MPAIVRRRWIVDEMLGRLARYLRFLGEDTEYVRGLSDADLLNRAIAEDRWLLTRDRQLGARAPCAVTLPSSYLAEQLRFLRARFPDLPTEVTFERCSLCNAPLERVESLAAVDELSGGLPAGATPPGPPLFRCILCRHLYWEGSHTRQIRRRLAATWSAEPATP
jgi:uncharacterized protein with PIN domain